MDISVSDGLQMAKNVDPDGYRTIGVITKVCYKFLLKQHMQNHFKFK